MIAPGIVAVVMAVVYDRAVGRARRGARGDTRRSGVRQPAAFRGRAMNHVAIPAP